MVEKYQPAEESGIDFDLESAQAANEAAEAEAAASNAPGSNKNTSNDSGKTQPAPKAANAVATTTPGESTATAGGAASATEVQPVKGAAKFFADDGPFMRFIWWSLRTVFSFVIPLCMFYVLIRNPQLVDGAYKMISPGVNPYPLLMKGGLANIMAFLIAIVPPLFGMWLASVMSRIKSLKPYVAVWIWLIIMFFYTVLFVVLARYFRII